MIGSNCSENNFDVRNLANTMLFMCADGHRHGQNHGVCRIEYAFGAGNKLRHSDLYSVRRDGIGTGYIELQLVQGDVQRQDGLCIFAVHTGYAEPHPNTEADPDAHAKAYTYADPNAETDFHAYTKAYADTGGENDSVRVCADGLERPDDVLQRSEHHV